MQHYTTTTYSLQSTSNHAIGNKKKHPQSESDPKSEFDPQSECYPSLNVIPVWILACQCSIAWPKWRIPYGSSLDRATSLHLTNSLVYQTVGRKNMLLSEMIGVQALTYLESVEQARNARCVRKKCEEDGVHYELFYTNKTPEKECSDRSHTTSSVCLSTYT